MAAGIIYGFFSMSRACLGRFISLSTFECIFTLFCRGFLIFVSFSTVGDCYRSVKSFWFFSAIFFLLLSRFGDIAAFMRAWSKSKRGTSWSFGNSCGKSCSTTLIWCLVVFGCFKIDFLWFWLILSISRFTFNGLLKLNYGALHFLADYFVPELNFGPRGLSSGIAIILIGT